MEKIIIRDNNSNVLLYLSKNSIIGFKYINNEIKNVNSNVLTYFNYFKLSNNSTILEENDEYKIILDNDSNLRHKYINGIDDLEWLFFNNGINSISYLGNENLNNKSKIFRFKKLVIITTLLGLIYSNTVSNYIHYNTSELELPDYTVSDMYNLIYSSIRLTDEEKNYLYNSDFFSDLLPLINSSEYLKLQYQNYFSNIGIISYKTPPISLKSAQGYYSIDTPNLLYIKNYEGINIISKDTLAHEFIHLCQDTSGYNLLIEACAEIISYEYFPDTSMSNYPEQVKLTKKLMEIIGSEPIWYYNFTGDFSKIEEKVKPYLTEDEYIEFLNDLMFDYTSSIENYPKYESLDNILKILYSNIYGEDIEDNIIFSLIDRNEFSLVRYYFNSRLKNESYYLDKSLGEYKHITGEEAVNEKILTIYEIVKTPLEVDEAFELIDTGNYNIRRDIDMNSAEIFIMRQTTSIKGLFITGTINGEKYIDVNVDDLVREGIIKANYYLVNSRTLTFNEYINHEYDDNAEIYKLCASDTVINGTDVYAFIPKKVYLPIVDSNEKTR